MADSKISALTALTGANLVAADIFPVVDVSATTAGSKSMLASELVIGLSGLGLVTGPASATDNAIVRFDGTTGKLVQNSAVTIADTTGAMAIAAGSLGASAPSLAITQTWNAAVDFKALTVNITNTSSNAASTLLELQIGGNPLYAFQRDGSFKIHDTTYSANSYLQIGAGVAGTILYNDNALGVSYRLTGDSSGSGGCAVFAFGAQGVMTWQSTNRQDSGAVDLAIGRQAANILRLGSAQAGAGVTGAAALQLEEMTAPAAPAANNVVIYAVDNGGKTQLCARFPTGAVQQLAIEP